MSSTLSACGQQEQNVHIETNAWTVDSSPTCTVIDPDEGPCSKRSARGGLCWAHLKRRQRGVARARPYGRDAWEKLNEALHEYADAEEQARFDQAAENLAVEALRYTRTESAAAVDEAKRRVRRCVHQFARDIKAAVQSADDEPDVRRHG